METQNNPPAPKESLLPESVTSATPLTPLQLNGYKLDVQHTLLTPEYLESLSAAPPQTEDGGV